MSGKNGLCARRLKESVAMLMIGDGTLAVIEPDRHVRLWHQGPDPWRRMMEPFLQRPDVTRLLGAAEVALGVWLASRQKV